ncbi:MAG: ATP-dependent Clp protease adapter ClpS [Planctomycetota bacterium]
MAETETEERTETELAKPWNVIVHDDPISLMSYVTDVFMKVFGYSRTKAQRHMLEVHNTGRSVLWTGAREQAEIFVTKLHGFYLKATLEQVE